MPPRINTALRISEEERRRWNDAADYLGISRAAFMRLAANEKASRVEKEQERTARLRRLSRLEAEKPEGKKGKP